MKVSLIIPVYNEEKVIKECLESLFVQRYKSLEIIVVDDGSSDDTLSLLAEIKVRNPKLKILRQDHKGAGAARNLGVGETGGKILVFVDADMIFDKDFVKELVWPIVNGQTIGTFSKNEYLANKDNVWARSWNINRGLPVNKMITDNYPDEQKVFRAILKSKFIKAGGFNEKAGYTDDWSLSEKLGVMATAVSGAKFYHKNPDNLKEVFVQSKWMAKRKYKFGLLGVIWALIRVSFPVSILGLRRGFSFLIFKTVSDLGQFVGIIEYNFWGKVAK